MSMRYIIAISFIIVLCACTTTQQKGEKLQETWEGRNVNDLIAALGPPAQIMDDGQGGKIYVYTTTKVIHSGDSSFTTYQGQRQGDYQIGRTYVPGNHLHRPGLYPFCPG